MPKKDLNPVFTKKNVVLPEEEATKTQGAKVWMPTAEENEALLRIQKRYQQQMLPAQQQFHTEWDNAKKIYEAYIVPDPLKESFKIPLSHMVIDAALAEEIDAFPDLVFETQDPDDQQKLPMLNSAKNYALKRTKWEKVKHEALRIRRIYGIAPVRIYYRREMRTTKQRIPVMGDSGITLGYEEVTDYPWDDICIEVIDNPRRFLIGDADHDIEDAADCVLLTDMDWDAFRQMVQHDRRFKNVEYVNVSWSNKDDIKGEIFEPSQQAPERTSGKVRVLEYWNKYKDEYVMIANDIIVRQTCLVDDHKELPFAVVHMYRRPHTFYSKGIPKLIESIEAAYNSVFQAEVRATKLAFPILVTSDDNTIDPRQIAPYPGVVLEGGLDSVDLKQLGSVPNESYRLKDKLEDILGWLTGINVKQINDTGSGRVGIEAMKKESSLARVTANLRENESNFAVRLGNLLLEDIMQYFPGPKMRRLAPQENADDLKNKTLKQHGIQLYQNDKGDMGVLEMRKIPLEGKRIKEKLSKTGVYSLSYSDDAGNSFVFARPEYIRCKSRLDVQAVRPSAMGSSKEAKKLVLMELSDHAIAVNQAAMQMGGTPPETDPATGQVTSPGVPGKPIWQQEWIEEQLAIAHDFPLSKAIVQDATNENDPEEQVKKLTDGIMKINSQKFPSMQQFMQNRQMQPQNPGAAGPPQGAPQQPGGMQPMNGNDMAQLTQQTA